MKLKSNLKTLIGQHGISIKVLATKSGVSRQTIHNWLAGAPPRNLDHVKAVANFFEVTVDALVFGSKEQKSTGEVLSPITSYREEINAGIFEVVLRPIKRNTKNES